MSLTFEQLAQEEGTFRSYTQLLTAVQVANPRPSAKECFSILHKHLGKASGIYVTPERIGKLMAAIGQSYKPQTVLDFTCGSGQLLYYCHFASELTGTDIDQVSIEFAQTLQPTINFLAADALSLDAKKKYDLIIANIPFGKRQPKKGPLEKQLLEKALTLLKDNGVFVIVVPPNMLTAPIYAPLRQKILTQFALDMIVTIPGSTLDYTSIPSAILVVRNGSPSDTVYLAHLDDGDRKILSNFNRHEGDYHVPLSQIIKDRWDRHFYLPKYTETEKLLNAQLTQELGSISSVVRGFPFKPVDRLEVGEYLILNPRYFRQNKLQLNDARTVKYANRVNEKRFQRAVLRPGDIVISLVFNPGLYIYRESDPPAVASQNVAIIRSNENEYIHTYLQSEVGLSAFKNNMERLGRGMGIRHLSIRDLRKIPIPVPPISDPNALSDEEIGQSDITELHELRDQLSFFRSEILTQMSEHTGTYLSHQSPELSHDNLKLLRMLVAFLENRFMKIDTRLNILQETTSQILSVVKVTQTDIEQIKRGYRNEEEKLLLMYRRLDNFISTAQQSQQILDTYEEIVQSWLEPCERLEEQSRIFLITGEYLWDELQRIKTQDYSPFIIQYCRAFESELLHKLFSAYHVDLYKRFLETDMDDLLSDSLKNDKTSTFAKAVQNNKPDYTLGQMNFIMGLIKPGGNTLKNSSLLQDFQEFGTRAFGQKVFRHEFREDIKKICKDFRNKSAHPYVLDFDEAKSCQLMIRKSLSEFLTNHRIQ